MEIQACGLTDVGRQRKNNEDAVQVRDDLRLFIVADGVGGAAAGEEASRIFVESCTNEFDTDSGWNRDYGPLIARCFINANQHIRDHAKNHPETHGMGCTGELLTFFDGEYYVGHVGDSRTYLVRDGHITLLTKDHSYIQEQIDLGLVTEEEAETHWLRNAIYRAVGHIEEIEADIITGKTKDGDCFLLCTDGLTDMVSDMRLLEIITSGGSVDERAHKLVDEANANGGKDNITALLCEVRGAPAPGLFSAMRSKLLGK